MILRSRGRVLEWLNTTYIYGRLPLLHSIAILIEFLTIMVLIARYNAFYRRRPIITTMITNAVLGGIADTVAQSITAFQARTRSLPASANTKKFFASDGVEMEPLNEKHETLNPDFTPQFLGGPQPFDFERLLRFMSYGFIMAPVQWRWFTQLNKWFPITKARGTVPALQRVAMDQLIFAPIGLSCFFTFMTITEGGGRRAVAEKFQHIYMPTLRANYMVWPAVQMLNFRVLPLQFQIPLVSTVGIAWTAYLSLTNAKEDA